MVPGLRGGRPAIRGMRITVGGVLGWLAPGMSEREILKDFPELTEADIRAALAFAAERERSTAIAAEWHARRPGCSSSRRWTERECAADRAVIRWT